MRCKLKTTRPKICMNTEPVLSFPVIRGLQVCREYYVAMWTLRMLRQISIFDEDELSPELRQRTLNRSRVPEMAGYVLIIHDYVFSALTVSIDSEVNFTSIEDRISWVCSLTDGSPIYN